MSERIAIVTGAARGIGAGTAIRLAADGMAVAVVDLNEADCAGTVKEIENAGGKALAVGADVSKTDQANAAVERVAAELGEPTVLVNNAGITRDAMLFKMTDEQWDSVIAVNLRGPFLMTRAAQKYMSAQKWGRIVNISSSSALGNRGQANYSATKAGIEGFTKTLAKELGRFGITANAVAPHFIATDMTADHGRQSEDVIRGTRGDLQEADTRGPGRPAGRRGGRSLLPGRRGRGLRLRPGHLRGGWPVPFLVRRRARNDTVLNTPEMLRERVRAFLAEHDPQEMPKQDFLNARFGAGLAWVHYPEGLGGLGVSRTLQSVVDAEFAAAGAPSNDPERNGIGLGMAAPTILAYGRDEQQKRWLRKLWTAEEIWCQLFSEPGAGSDLAALATRAVQ